MCITCIKNKCTELSDLIYELKHKLTDDEFKRILDGHKFIFDSAKNLETHFVEKNQNNDHDEEPEEESDDESEEVNSALYTQGQCECMIRGLTNYNCARTGNIRECITYNTLIHDIPNLSYIADLCEDTSPNIPSTFSLQTEPIFMRDEEFQLTESK